MIQDNKDASEWEKKKKVYKILKCITFFFNNLNLCLYDSPIRITCLSTLFCNLPVFVCSFCMSVVCLSVYFFYPVAIVLHLGSSSHIQMRVTSDTKNQSCFIIVDTNSSKRKVMYYLSCHFFRR